MADRDSLVDILFKKHGEVFRLPDAATLTESYQNAQPYPHIVMDDFFTPNVLQMVKNDLVEGEKEFEVVFTDEFQKNKTISTGDAVPQLINLLGAKFAAPEMLRYLEKLTGLKKLIPDPYYNTDYGYYHIVGSGGVLGSHVDHSRHSSLNVPHVLNLVVYLTENWKEPDGGTLCLFDETGKRVVTRVPCKHNRAVIFACTPTSYHGVEPVAENTNRRRHSLYFAYYSVDSLGGNAKSYFPGAQSGVSNADPSVNYGTYFVVPFLSLFRPKNWVHLRMRLVYLANLFLPPIFVVGIKKLLGRSRPS